MISFFMRTFAQKLQKVTRLIYVFLLLCACDMSAQTIDSVVVEHYRGRGVQATGGNKLRFYDNGNDKFVDLFEDVRKAKSFVHLEYFNFRNDSIAGLLFKLLAEKAKEGVEVRALYDSFGNSSNNRPIKRAMHDSICAQGIKLVKYDPIVFPWVNHIIPRDHRKIVVIDGRVAYTGGMNVADYYIDGIPGIGEWHDLHMRIDGPAVDDLQRIFAQIWQKETGEQIAGLKYFPRENGVQMYEEEPSVNAGRTQNRKFALSLQKHVDDEAKLLVIDRCSGETSDAIRDLYVTLLDNAQHSVKLVNPYFVPTHRVRSALKRAVDRGVDVQILLSAKSDIPLTPEAAHYVGNNLMKRGARVWLFEGGFHHTKLMIVDDCVATVGSSNLDARSLRCDFEVNTLVLSVPHAQQLVELFEDQKQSAVEIHKGYWKSRSAWKQFVGWFGNLLTPVL